MKNPYRMTWRILATVLFVVLLLPALPGGEPPAGKPPGGGRSKAGIDTGTLPDPVASAEQRLIREEIAVLQQEIEATHRRVQSGTASLSDILPLRRQLLALQRQHAGALVSRESLAELLRREIKTIEGLLKESEHSVQVGLVPTSAALPFRRELLSLERQLAALEQAPWPAGARSSGVMVPESTRPSRRSNTDPATRDPHLARGVLEEELNLDLDAAIAAYRLSIAEYEGRRADAAHALFRLAECYRKQGRVAEADSNYRRILREFSDFAQLSELSQRQLSAFEMSADQTRRGERPMSRMDFGSRKQLTGEGWEQRAPSPLEARHGHTAIWTGREYVAFGGQGPGVAYGNGASYDPATDRWERLPEESQSKLGRTQHTAIWTGEKMIIWGGYGGTHSSAAVAYNSGACFDPRARRWSATTTDGAPSARFDHTAVWTGKEMIIWGGYPHVRASEAGARAAAHLHDGARYDPATDSWKPVAAQGAPSPRSNHSAVWTGTHMIVWGGGNHTQALQDGAMYDPLHDRWLPLPADGAPQGRLFHHAIWTGEEMIIFGGRLHDMSGNAAPAARFNPVTGRWRSTPHLSWHSCVVWTGTELIAWGGETAPKTMKFLNTGARFDPQRDLWTPITTAAAPPARALDSRCAVWTGEGLLFFGGWSGPFYNDTWFYRPINAQVRPGANVTTTKKSALPDDNHNGRWTQHASAPLSARHGNTAIWTGTEMIVFGGESPGISNGDGARYQPQTDSWTILPTETILSRGRNNHSAVWTGTEMIIWGGFGGRSGEPPQFYNTGARFNPQTGQWKPISDLGAPSPRFNHSAVWSGTEMIVWGGYDDPRAAYDGAYADHHLDDGARYNPSTGRWLEVSKLNAPSKRYGHSALWTGSRMIIWGGADATRVFNDGFYYDPQDDQWRPLPSQNAPAARFLHHALWTGKEMVIFGGVQRDFRTPVEDAAAFNPETGQWRKIASTEPGACYALSVWTGKEIIAWGGWRRSVLVPPATQPNDQRAKTNDLVPENPNSLEDQHADKLDARRTSSTQGFINTGARYDLAKDAWIPITTPKAPPARGHTRSAAVWTGETLLFFGGWNGGQYFNDTWSYRPPEYRKF